MSKEEVLCVLRERLPPEWVELTSTVRLKLEPCFAAIEGAGGVFLPRFKVEKDSRYKQIIPYVIVREREEGTFASYIRAGSESRLHDLTSCGIGGHIGRSDLDGGTNDLKTAIFRGLLRELTEEFLILPRAEELTFLGVINEDVTSVGSVHLGLVFLMEVDSRHGVVPGGELNGFAWLKREELGRRKLELWSSLALTFVDDLL